MNKIAEIMFNNHSHVELHMDNPDAIIYTEAAVIRILKELGHEAPVWDEQTETVREQLDRLRETDPDFDKTLKGILQVPKKPKTIKDLALKYIHAFDRHLVILNLSPESYCSDLLEYAAKNGFFEEAKALTNKEQP